MTDERRAKLGKVGWMDLTVDDASGVREFYRAVVGWKSEDCPMGEYSDYVMGPGGGGDPIGGVCHARGGNAGLPAKWLIYINIDSIEKSLEEVKSHGGKLLAPIKTMPGHGRYCIVEDPAGAPFALFEPI